MQILVPLSCGRLNPFQVIFMDLNMLDLPILNQVNFDTLISIILSTIHMETIVDTVICHQIILSW